jgi:hypothetical protein
MAFAAQVLHPSPDALQDGDEGVARIRTAVGPCRAATARATSRWRVWREYDAIGAREPWIGVRQGDLPEARTRAAL